MADAQSSQSTAQLQIRLLTKQEQYGIPDSPFDVPAKITTSELNTLVNEILKESAAPGHTTVEFDFLACGEFIRLPLREHLANHSVSSEDVVDVEYVERFPAPEPQDCLMHDDWVSAVNVRNDWILTGCYDNTLHLWTTSGKHHLTIPGHSAAVRGVSWIDLNENMGSFVSVSQDQTAMLWNWNISKNKVDCIYVCRGHKRSVECVGINHDKSILATGSWDTMLKLWATSLDKSNCADREGDGESASKQPKVEEGKYHTRTPLVTLQGHKEAISAVQWSDSEEICTASWDHTLRLWDAEIGGIKNEIAGNKSFFDMSYSPLNKTVITASADRHLRLYDFRSTEGSIVKSTFTSHTQWVQAVRWSTTDERLFLSASHDKQVKLWDTRSPNAPLFDLSGHEDKVMCCNWSNPRYMVSGGADNTLRIFKSKRKLPDL